MSDLDPLKEADEALKRTKGGVTLARDVVIGLIEAARRQDMWHSKKEPEETATFPLDEATTTSDDVPGQLLEVELPPRQVEVERETESTAGTSRVRLELLNPRESEVHALIKVLRD